MKKPIITIAVIASLAVIAAVRSQDTDPAHSINNNPQTEWANATPEEHTNYELFYSNHPWAKRLVIPPKLAPTPVTSEPPDAWWHLSTNGDWDFEIDGTNRYAVLGKPEIVGTNRFYKIIVSTNAAVETVPKSDAKAEADARVTRAFQIGFDAGVEAAEVAHFKDSLPALKARARQNLQPPPQQP